MYTTRLDVFEVCTAVNKTYFKAKVISYFGTDLQTQKIRRFLVLGFNEGMLQVLKDHLEQLSYLKEYKILAKALRILR